MKKLVTVILLCLFALLLIAAISPEQNRPRPRPCGTRTQCFNLLFPIVTFTATPTAIQIPDHTPTPIFVTTPNYSFLFGRGILCLPSWTDGDGVEHCGPIPNPMPTFIAPYPPPVTAPPAGYP